MKKKNIATIVRKYLSNRFSLDVEERVQRWMIKEKDSKAKEQASSAYWDELNVEADSHTYTVLKRVNKRIGYFKTSFISKAVRIAAVVVPLCVMIGGYSYYASTQNQLIEVSVAHGQTKYLLLPDSSEVWINAGTTIKYPKEFSQKQRVIHLNGEAYFSIIKQSTKPFIVQTKQLSVEVLGTAFNVKAYANDENTTTTLTRGKVEVNTPSKDAWILKPNQQLTYNNITSIAKITKISQIEAEGWITGNLIFTNASFSEIVQTLERRFNITIEQNGNTLVSKLYTIKFLKGENLDESLDVLKDIVGFTYQKVNNKVIIHKNI